MEPYLFLPYHLSCLSHRKTYWDHVSAFIRPYKLYFGDLDLHGPSVIFSLM
jgi:hypothetical protein